MQNQEGIAFQIKQFFINLDYFAVQPSLNVFKKSKYSTLVGAFLTVCVGILTLSYLTLELSELISKSLPNVIQSDKQVVETSAFPLMQDNFTLAITVTDMNRDPLKSINQYFTIKVENCIRTRKLNVTSQQVEINTECTTYPTHACTTEDFVTDTQRQYFKKTRLGTVQCIQRDILKTNPPKLKGIVSGSEYAYINIIFAMCKNSTTIQTCAPQEEILNGIDSGYYVVYMSDTLIQMGNSGEVSQDIIKLQYSHFSKISSITIYQTLRIIETLTDIGLITNSVIRISSLYNDEYLVYHQIILDDKSTQYQRSYIKLQAILSKIGGLWQILFMIIATFLKPFIETDMYMKICNQIFRIETKENKKSNKLFSESMIDITKMISILNPKFENTILEIILVTLNCKRKKRLHLEQAKQSFSSKMDVVDIALTSFQLDKLKSILLTSDQRRVFEFIPKTLIYMEKMEHIGKKGLDLVQGQNEQFLQACLSYFRIITNQMQQGEIDKRLLGYLDSDIVQMFHKLIQIQSGQCVLDRGSIFLEQRSQGSESCNSLVPISLESPAAKVLQINFQN